jgi:hypothetical protein
MTELRAQKLSLSLAAAITLGLASCDSPGVAEPLKAEAPRPVTTAHVTEVTLRAAYLDATLESSNWSLRFFFPATKACARVIRRDARVEYRTGGPVGEVQSGGEACDPVGIVSLPEWRDRRARSRGDPLPPFTARFKSIYTDEELVLVRGRFPLTGEIGWDRGDDTVAVLPHAEGCNDVLARGVAPLEFHAQGPQVFTLVSEEGSCPVIGFALPLRGP